MHDNMTLAEKSNLLDSVGFSDNNQEWEEPTPLEEEEEPPRFPVEALPANIKNYIAAVSDSLQTTPDMAATCSLSALALCTQGKLLVQPKSDWKEPLNLYVVNIAEPGERKSAVHKAIFQPIRQWEKEQAQQMKQAVMENKAERARLEKRQEFYINQIAKGSGEGEENEKILAATIEALTHFKDLHTPRLIADDITSEALGALMHEQDGRMAILAEESGIFTLIKNPYGKGANFDIYLKSYSGDTVIIDRKGGKTEYIDSPALTMCLMAQPYVIEEIVRDEALRGKGLMGRFLFCKACSKIGARAYQTGGIPFDIAEPYEKTLQSLLEIPYKEEPELLRFTPEAEAVGERFFYWLEPKIKDDFDDFADWASKIHGTTMRIAGLLHLAEQKAWGEHYHDVSAQTVENAVLIGKYFIDHARAVFHAMPRGRREETQSAKYILKMIRNQGSGRISKRDLYRLCQGRFSSAEELSPAIELLVKNNYLYQVPLVHTAKGGRKSIVYMVNPYLFEV